VRQQYQNTEGVADATPLSNFALDW